MQKSDIKLLAIFVLFCAVIWLRVSSNDNKYITPDSKHYLRSAKNFNAGLGFITPETFPFKDQKSEKRLAMWPIGYPFAIASVSSLTGLPLRWASKVVNMIFSALSLLLLRKLFGSETWFVAISFFCFTSLEIFSFTWSEGPFIFSTILLTYILTKWDSLKYNWLALSVCLIISFTLRYAAVVYFFEIGAIILFLAYKRNWKSTIPYIIACIIASGFVIYYLLYNEEHNGYMTGMDRFAREDENTLQYFIMFAKGVFNEFFIIRNYYFLGEPKALFISLGLLQMGLIFYLVKIKGWIKIDLKNKIDKASTILIGTGVFYFIAMSIIRFVIIFDPLDYRILSPASIPILIGLMGLITNRKNYYPKAKIPVVVFFVLSLLMNLPKEYLLGLFN